jgi:peptide/nickel transport system permease protein
MSSRSTALRYYILSRILFAPLMILTITSLIFLLLRATPGDPVDVLLGPRAPESAREALNSVGAGFTSGNSVFAVFGEFDAV